MARISREENYKFGWLQGSRELKERNKFWLRGSDLNRRPPGYEPDELPGCSTPQNHHSGTVGNGQTVLMSWDVAALTRRETQPPVRCANIRRYDYVSIAAMRRAQAILVILALLATPLALLARSTPGMAAQCSRMCLLLARSLHAGKHSRKVPCFCGASAQDRQCAMSPSPRTPDYGLNAPMPPTRASALAELARPEFAQGRAVFHTPDSMAGFPRRPFEPPQA